MTQIIGKDKFNVALCKTLLHQTQDAGRVMGTIPKGVMADLRLAFEELMSKFALHNLTPHQALAAIGAFAGGVLAREGEKTRLPQFNNERELLDRTAVGAAALEVLRVLDGKNPANDNANEKGGGNGSAA